MAKVNLIYLLRKHITSSSQKVEEDTQPPSLQGFLQKSKCYDKADGVREPADLPTKVVNIQTTHCQLSPINMQGDTSTSFRIIFTD